MRMLPSIAIVVGLFAQAAHAQSLPMPVTPVPVAQPPAPIDPDQQDILVNGVSKKSVEETVRMMTMDTGATGQIARWNDPICVNIANLDQPYAGFAIDRIYTWAERLGLKTGKDDCKPNILIVMTTEPDAVVQKLGKLGVDGKDIKELMKPRPVRWYSVTESRNLDGRSIHGFSPGELAINPTTAVSSRISEQTREATVGLVIIVDFKRIEGVEWPQLGDYLSMVALGRPSFGPDYSGSTILALFQDRDRGVSLPAALTAQDQGFLKGLYSSFDLVRGTSQRAAIRDAARKGADLADPKK